MADNTVLNLGSGGDTIASDDIAGVKHQRVKLSLGADGTAADAPVGGGVEAGSLRVTLASDSTGVLSVDDNGSTLSIDDGAGSITVDNGGTFAVQATLAAETTKVIGTVNVAAAQTLATVTTVGAVTAITNALPAGTNAIGKLAANSGVDIGDVDVTTVGTITPGTASTSLGKAEDAAHTSGDVGVMSLAVRRDADTSLVGTDGDYAPLQVNAAGSLKVAITAGAGSGGTSIADGASFTRDTTSLTPVGGVVEASAPTVTAGDAVALSLTTGGAVRVAVASGGIAGAVVDSVAGATDEGVLAVAVRDDALATLTPVDGDYTQLRTNARGAQWVALDSTVAQTVTLAAGTATNEIVGDVAQDAAIGGNPVSVGLRASTATPTAMSADGDSVYGWADLNGAVVVAGRIVDDAAFTPGTSRVHPIAFQADETATDSVDEGDAGCPRMTLDRKVIITSYAHAAAGGHSPFKSLDLDESEEEIKGSGGKLFWIHVINLAATKRYLKIYNNTAAGTTVGTTVPDLTFPIPTLADTNGAGFCLNFGDHGIALGTGITVAATTGFADNDAGAPGANEVILNAGYL